MHCHCVYYTTRGLQLLTHWCNTGKLNKRTYDKTMLDANTIMQRINLRRTTFLLAIDTIGKMIMQTAAP